MDIHARWLEATQKDGLLNPEHNVISSPAVIIAQIMIEAELRNLAGFKKSNCFSWPMDPEPTFWSGSLIIEINAHGRYRGKVDG